MIKRTHKEHIRKLLKENLEWNILDLGCGRFAWEEAQTLSDLVDHSELYPQKRFVKCDASETPFEDKEFDFVIASHITEHIRNLDVFLNELSRISKHGYIEVPLPLFDNLTYGNREEHIWWVGFDDVKHEITFMPKAQLIQERILPVELLAFEQFFRSSMALELHWKDSIEWRIGILPVVLNDDLTYDIWPEPHSDNFKQQEQLGVLRKKKMNIVQIGCGDGDDSVFSFVVDHEKDIENCILIDANPEVLKKATAKYSKFPFCELRNLAVLPIETEGYEIKLFSSIADPCLRVASVNKEHVVAHIREQPSLEFKVPTISLTSLLKEYIKTDYLFIDAEGLDALNLLSVNFDTTNLKQIVFEHIHTDDVCRSGPRLKCLIKYLEEFKFVVDPDPDSEYNMIAKR